MRMKQVHLRWVRGMPNGRDTVRCGTYGHILPGVLVTKEDKKVTCLHCIAKINKFCLTNKWK
jgi:hypothetical protein